MVDVRVGNGEHVLHAVSQLVLVGGNLQVFTLEAIRLEPMQDTLGGVGPLLDEDCKRQRVGGALQQLFKVRQARVDQILAIGREGLERARAWIEIEDRTRM